MMTQRRRMLMALGGGDIFEFTYDGTYTDSRDESGIGVIKFTSSGTLTVTKGGTPALYLIGGGGGGGGAASATAVGAGGGGGSGYWQTIENIIINVGIYEIAIGTGGAGGTASCKYNSGLGMYLPRANPGSAGGATSALGYTVNGGSGGTGGANAWGTGGAGGNNGTIVGTGGIGGSPNGGNGGYSNTVGGWGGGHAGSAGWVTLTFA